MIPKFQTHWCKRKTHPSAGLGDGALCQRRPGSAVPARRFALLPGPGAGCLGQGRGPDPGGRAGVPCRETGRAEKSRGAGRPRRGDSAARSTGLRPVFPVPLPPPRCWCVPAWAGGDGRRHPWTGGAAAAGGGTPKEGARRPPRPATTAPPLPCRALPSPPLPTWGRGRHLRREPAPAWPHRPRPRPAGNRPTRRERPQRTRSQPQPRPQSQLGPALGFDAPSRCPLRGGRAGQGALPAPGRLWDLCSRCRTPSASRRVSPRDVPAPNSRSSPLPSPRAGAVSPAPLVPRGRCLRSPPRGPRCGHELPGFSSSFFCVLWLLSPCCLRSSGALCHLCPRSRTRRAPAGPPRPVPRPPRTWAARTAGLGRDRLFSNGIKRLSVTFSVISTFRESAILRGKWERCHRRVGVFVYPGYCRGGRWGGGSPG